VRPVPLVAGSRLRTLRGTLVDVLAAAAALPSGGEGGSSAGGEAGEGPSGGPGAGEPWPEHLRVVLDEGPRAGLADEVRERIPAAVEVVLARREGGDGAGRVADPDRLRRTPRDLFAEYLREHEVADERLVPLFDELVEQVTADDDAPVGAPARGAP
jgi:exonuclease SbcD